MKKRVIKLIICIMLISALMIGFCSAYASASNALIMRAKAGIAAAMLAANLFINPVNAALDDTLLEGIDPIGYVQTIQETPWTEYIDRSVITVRPDVVTIDGVSYSDIWIGPDAAESLRLAGLDFASAYNILSNQSSAITYAEGKGYFDGIPVYDVGGSVYRSPMYYLSYGTSSVGDASVSLTESPISTTQFNVNGTITLSDGTTASSSHSYYYNNPPQLGLIVQNFRSSGSLSGQIAAGKINSAGTGLSSLVATITSTDPDIVVRENFSFDYTSGDITVLPDPDDGLLMRVPSSYSGQSGSVFNYDIHDLINVYPQVDDSQGHELIFDPSLNPDFDVDLDMGNALGDIITAVILAKLADLLGDDAEIIYAPFPEKDEPAPVDPDLPDPEVPIGEQDPIWLDNLLRWLKQTIDNLGDRIHDSIDAIHEDIQEIISSIEELADKILEDIELGPAKLFDKALDILKTLFLPILLPIRAMMNLWHYVVEWIQSVSTPFTWIFGIMSNTSGNMVLPIYALLAGGICISIYKALGR